MNADLQLQHDVTAELEFDPAVNAACVGVAVKHGIVTLAGHLASFAEKLAAEHAAQRVRGVRAVVVELEVQPANPLQLPDARLADAALDALNWNINVPDASIQVQVERGWVTLSGTVTWDYQRKAAVQAVAPLRGVLGLTDNIVIAPRVQPVDVERKIEAMLTRQAQVDAQNIEISITDGVVTLRGTVHSWAERASAHNAAWSAPGISRVIDELAVE